MPHPLLEHFVRHRLVAIVRTDSAVAALALSRAVVAGGFRLIEVTLTTPGAKQIIDELLSLKDVFVGCGTVLTSDDALRAIDWGAKFIVSPHTDPKLLATTQNAGVMAIAGALTPTEILTAWHSGADLIKLFPITQVGGVEYLKALRAPFPDIPLMPTGGIGEDHFLQYLEAGAAAVGLGYSLAPPHEVQSGKWGEIAARASDWIALFHKCVTCK